MIIQPSKKSPQASTTTDGLMSSIDKIKLNNTNIAYGTCTTAASTAAKVVNITGNENWDLLPGSVVTIKFSYTNTASNPTLNVNNKGAKPIIYNTSTISTSNLAYAGTANQYITYVYTGSSFVFIGWSTTYSNMTGASSSSAGKSGLVPAPAAGDQDKFLKANGTWAKCVTSLTLSLTASGWSSNSQTVTASGATTSNIVIVSPIPADQDIYSNCDIKCSSQSNGSLTFTCNEVPTSDISVNVVLI